MCSSEKNTRLSKCAILCVKQVKHHLVAKVCSSISEWSNDRTWMHSCKHSEGSYSHNSSFAGHCCFSENLILYLMIYGTSAFPCCKGTISHITLFVKHCVNPNIMHLFHAPPYISSIQNYLKKKKVIQLKFSFHSSVSLFCSYLSDSYEWITRYVWRCQDEDWEDTDKRFRSNTCSIYSDTI